jgi:hypothetical protein
MKYDFVKAVGEVIEDCVSGGRGILQRKDERGNITLWLEAEWVEYDKTHDVVELFVCYSDTGRIAYSRIIEETMVEK